MYHRSFRAHTNSSINSLCLVESTNFVLSGGGNDCSIRLHNLNEAEVQSSDFPKEHISAVNSIDISESREAFVSGGGDTIVVWDLVKQRKLTRYQSTNSNIRDEIFECKILNDNLVVSCGSNCFVNFYDLRQSQRTKPIFSIKAGNDNLNSLDYDPGSTLLSVASLDGSLASVDLRKNELITDRLDNGGLLHVRFCPKYRTLITFEDGTVKLCSTPGLQIITDVKLPTRKLTYSITSELVSDYYDNTDYIISGSESGSVHMWKYNPVSHTAAAFKTLEPQSQGTDTSHILSVVKFNKSSNRLISSSENGILHIWENVL